MPEPSPYAILLCHTCRHLEFLYHRAHLGVGRDWRYWRTPRCALRLPWGGRALSCDRYEREPGSDDEIHVMDPHEFPPVRHFEGYSGVQPRKPGRWPIAGTANVMDTPIGGWAKPWQAHCQQWLAERTRVTPEQR